jgi:hypothetical protein
MVSLVNPRIVSTPPPKEDALLEQLQAACGAAAPDLKDVLSIFQKMVERDAEAERKRSAKLLWKSAESDSVTYGQMAQEESAKFDGILGDLNKAHATLVSQLEVRRLTPKAGAIVLLSPEQQLLLEPFACEDEKQLREKISALEESIESCKQRGDLYLFPHDAKTTIPMWNPVCAALTPMKASSNAHVSKLACSWSSLVGSYVLQFCEQQRKLWLRELTDVVSSSSLAERAGSGDEERWLQQMGQFSGRVRWIMDLIRDCPDVSTLMKLSDDVLAELRRYVETLHVDWSNNIAKQKRASKILQLSNCLPRIKSMLPLHVLRKQQRGDPAR